MICAEDTTEIELDASFSLAPSSRANAIGTDKASPGMDSSGVLYLSMIREARLCNTEAMRIGTPSYTTRNDSSKDLHTDPRDSSHRSDALFPTFIKKEASQADIFGTGHDAPPLIRRSLSLRVGRRAKRGLRTHVGPSALK
mgnify:CR=1 FL=1